MLCNLNLNIEKILVISKMYKRKDMLLSVHKDCCWSSYTAKQKDCLERIWNR